MTAKMDKNSQNYFERIEGKEPLPKHILLSEAMCVHMGRPWSTQASERLCRLWYNHVSNRNLLD